MNFKSAILIASLMVPPLLQAKPDPEVLNAIRDQGFNHAQVANVHPEAFEFGRGWTSDRASVDLLAPRKTSLHAIPLAWTPGTAGPTEAEVVYLDAVTEEELAKYKGKLRGKVVMLNEPTDTEEPRRPISQRYSVAGLGEMKNFDLKAPASDAPAPEDSIAQRRKGQRFNEAREAFIKAPTTPYPKT